MNQELHYSVLLNESIDLLNVKADGIYVDGTFGRGGHTRVILDKLSNKGRLIAFDKDIEAVEYAKQNIHDERLSIVHGSFANLPNYLHANNIVQIDGLLLDLGVSSPQLDTESRGFSFRFNALLDMRMDTSCGMTLGEWLNSANEKDIDTVLNRYGEERFHRKIAAGIVKARQIKPLETTFDLIKILDDNIPFKEKDKHFATRSFQAFRIYINNELSDIEQILNEVPNYLAQYGRIVVISFHSLEDRIVKDKFNQLSKVATEPKWIIPQENSEPSFKVIAKKIRAKDTELKQNVRSRSAIMRVLEKIK